MLSGASPNIVRASPTPCSSRLRLLRLRHCDVRRRCLRGRNLVRCVLGGCVRVHRRALGLRHAVDLLAVHFGIGVGFHLRPGLGRGCAVRRYTVRRRAVIFAVCFASFSPCLSHHSRSSLRLQNLGYEHRERPVQQVDRTHSPSSFSRFSAFFAFSRFARFGGGRAWASSARSLILALDEHFAFPAGLQAHAADFLLRRGRHGDGRGRALLLRLAVLFRLRRRGVALALLALRVRLVVFARSLVVDLVDLCIRGRLLHAHAHLRLPRLRRERDLVALEEVVRLVVRLLIVRLDLVLLQLRDVLRQDPRTAQRLYVSACM